MSNFENGVINGYIYYSRFVASWTKMNTKLGRPTYFDDSFNDWLRSMGISESEVAAIHELGSCGKLELETHARKWLSEH